MAFSASLLRNNQLQPPATFLIPTATRTDVVTSKAGFNQKLPWFGTSYSVSWSAAHTAWNGGSWNGNVWTGSCWCSTSWAGTSWSGHMWSGDDWPRTRR